LDFLNEASFYCNQHARPGDARKNRHFPIGRPRWLQGGWGYPERCRGGRKPCETADIASPESVLSSAASAASSV